MQQAIEEAKKMIEEINGEKDGYYDTKEDRIILLEELIERLEEIEQDNGWISVSERLPDKWGYYIIFPDKYYSTAEWRNGKWIYNDENGYDQEAYVSHWRLLPPEFLPPTNL